MVHLEGVQAPRKHQVARLARLGTVGATPTTKELPVEALHHYLGSTVTGPRHPRAPRPTGPRANQSIRAPRVLVIGADGARLGEMPTAQALELARAAELDLVEIAPNATPPVCRIADLGKLRYEASLKEKAARKHTHTDEVKELKLRPGIGDHDYEVKRRKLVELLEKGYRVKITVTLRGRLQSRPEAASAVLDRVEQDTATLGKCEGRRKIGRNAFMLVVPVKPAKPTKSAKPARTNKSELQVTPPEGATSEQA